ncbi:hypothetical protein M885DRAFT_464687 [Pelagophyceae sp. CCMP2097]|nr:hypothetical protein M885DRAFT_464687 [Pelagophyceae sp. CCMP2097]
MAELELGARMAELELAARAGPGAAGGESGGVVLLPFRERRLLEAKEAKLLPSVDVAADKFRVVKIGAAQASKYCTNFVRTSKYTVSSFVPLFLCQAFDPRLHAANTFFLIVCGMQMVPYITYTMVVTLGGVEVGTPTTALPLAFVVFVDALFQGLEDAARHAADREANDSHTGVLDAATGCVEACAWRDVRVGDVVVCRNRDVVPADLAILQVAGDADGVCYVETKSLDGETNLKQRVAVKEARRRLVPVYGADDSGYPRFEAAKLKGHLECEHPNDVISKFQGSVVFDAVGSEDECRCAVTPEHVYLRGCTVRSSAWIAGLVVNTGTDTKIMMSIKEPPAKESSLVIRINELLKYVVALLVIVCVIGASVSNAWLHTTSGREAWYLGFEDVDSRWGSRASRKKQAATVNVEETWIIKFFYYFLLLAQFVPVSLYVSMSMTKNFQALFMDWDVQMYHADSDTPAKVKTMALNEELGQISHVFSDKTGTLTCNVMDFRKFSVGGVSYGRGITAIGAAALVRQKKDVPREALEANAAAQAASRPHVTFYDPRLEADLNQAEAGTAQQELIVDFFRCLAICHTVLVEQPAKGDEAAFVEAAPTRTWVPHWARRAAAAAVDVEKSDFQRAAAVKKPRGASVQPGVSAGRPDVKLSASSPDDEALVCGAKYFGLHFESRRGGMMEIFNEHSQKAEHFQVIEMLDFNSDRKRMSVILRRGEAISIYVKGADTVMETRLAPGQDALKAATFEHMVGFSAEGLRTLVCATAELPLKPFETWLKKYRAATTDLDAVAKRARHEPNTIDVLMDDAERAFGAGLRLIGSTAIEDRLQDGVPETVHALLDAGVKVWVLTGDKEETAINIGVACQLLEPPETMEQIIVNSRLFHNVCTQAETLTRLNHAHVSDVGDLVDAARRDAARLALASLFERELLRLSTEIHLGTGPVKPRALIIDGESLLYALLDDEPEEFETGGFLGKLRRASGASPAVDVAAPAVDVAVPSVEAPSKVLEDVARKPRCRNALLQLAKRCKAVVGCRVSPMQKRQMVELVRFDAFPGARPPRTLAIGDGANDVPMIQGAHVGVGISGQEGMQAVNNSDFAIAQFRFLRRLLLVHGRWNYRRTSRLVCHIFYKNVLQAMLNFWFAAFNHMSGTKFVVEYAASTVYAVLYTAFPIILVGIFDQDVDEATALSAPELYQDAVRDAHFDRFIFGAWIVEGFAEAFLAVLIPALMVDASLSAGDADGSASVYELGAVAWTIIVVIANTKLMLNQYRFTKLDVVVYAFSIGAWFAVGTVYGLLPPSSVSAGYPEWEWYRVFPRVLCNSGFWCGTILGVIWVWVRDFAWKSFVRLRSPKPYHLYGEHAKFVGGDPALSKRAGQKAGRFLDPSLRDVPRPSQLVLTAIDADFEGDPDFEAGQTGASPLYGGGRASLGRASSLRDSFVRDSYHAQRPVLTAGDRQNTTMGFAYSTDEDTHLKEIQLAKSHAAFPNCWM